MIRFSFISGRFRCPYQRRRQHVYTIIVCCCAVPLFCVTCRLLDNIFNTVFTNKTVLLNRNNNDNNDNSRRRYVIAMRAHRLYDARNDVDIKSGHGSSSSARCDPLYVFETVRLNRTSTMVERSGRAVHKRDYRANRSRTYLFPGVFRIFPSSTVGIGRFEYTVSRQNTFSRHRKPYTFRPVPAARCSSVAFFPYPTNPTATQRSESA